MRFSRPAKKPPHSAADDKQASAYLRNTIIRRIDHSIFPGIPQPITFLLDTLEIFSFPEFNQRRDILHYKKGRTKLLNKAEILLIQFVVGKERPLFFFLQSQNTSTSNSGKTLTGRATHYNVNRCIFQLIQDRGRVFDL